MRISLFILGLSIFSNSFGQIPRDTSYTPNIVWTKIRKDHPEAKIAKADLSSGIIQALDVTYAVINDTPYGKRELHLDIFQPAKKGIYPALIMIHGGGWKSGDKSMQRPMAQRLALKGFVTICVEYQLSLEAKYPAALHNIKAAVRYARANASKYGIDTGKIAISGCSAGGHLALLTAMTNGVKEKEGELGNNEASSIINAAIDIDGVVDFMAPMSLNLNRKPGSPDIEWLGGSFYEKPGTWKDASPIFWANEKSVPVLFINSDFSRFHAGQDELIGMMKEWEIYTEVYKINVNIHPFWLFEPWIDPTVSTMEKFLKKTLLKN